MSGSDECWRPVCRVRIVLEYSQAFGKKEKEKEKENKRARDVFAVSVSTK